MSDDKKDVKNFKPVKQIKDIETEYEDLTLGMLDSLLDAGFICMERDFIYEFIDDIDGDLRKIEGDRGDWLNPSTHAILRFT